MFSYRKYFVYFFIVQFVFYVVFSHVHIGSLCKWFHVCLGGVPVMEYQNNGISEQCTLAFNSSSTKNSTS